MPKKLDSAIIDLVDEELEDEVLHAELYIDCFYSAKALLRHYIDTRKKRVLPQMKGPDRRLKGLMARIENRSADSCTRVFDVIRSDMKVPFRKSRQNRSLLKGTAVSWQRQGRMWKRKRTLPNCKWRYLP